MPIVKGIITKEKKDKPSINKKHTDEEMLRWPRGCKGERIIIAFNNATGGMEICKNSGSLR